MISNTEPSTPTRFLLVEDVEVEACVHALAMISNTEPPTPTRFLLVEDVEVEACVHALAGAASGEGPPAPHHHVEHTEGDEVWVTMGTALQPHHHVSQFWHGRGSQAHVGQVLLHLPINKSLVLKISTVQKFCKSAQSRNSANLHRPESLQICMVTKVCKSTQYQKIC